MEYFFLNAYIYYLKQATPPPKKKIYVRPFFLVHNILSSQTFSGV